MIVAIGSDHAGFLFKEEIKKMLQKMGHEVMDFGTHSEESTDYPIYCRPVAEAIQKGEANRGIVLGGSGNGEAMVANRVPGVRCAICWNEKSARLAREHNDSNCLSIGARMMDLNTALHIVKVWFEAEFEGGRHIRRIELIDHPEKAGATQQ